MGTINTSQGSAIAVVGSQVWIGFYGNSEGSGGIIRRYDFSGAQVGSINQEQISGLAVVGSQVWAAQYGNSQGSGGTIRRYNFSGTPAGSINQDQVMGLAVVGSQVWAAQYGNSEGSGGRIRRYDFSGTPAGSINQDQVMGLAVVGSQVWAAQYGNSEGSGGMIRRYDFSGTPAGSINQDQIKALAVVGSQVWAAQYGNSEGSGGRIRRYDFTGASVGSINQDQVRALAVVEVIDCNSNGIADGSDIAGVTSVDCNLNQIPDECDIDQNSTAPGGPFFCTEDCLPDCNSNGIPDSCDIANSTSPDCNTNLIPDECDLLTAFSADCNTDLVPDECDIQGITSNDCNTNAVPDECDIVGVTSVDCDANGTADECQAASGDIAWVGASDGSFGSNGNWSPASVPGTAGNAILENATPDENRCILSGGGSSTVCSVTVGASGSGRQILRISGSTIVTNERFDINTGGDVELQGGTIAGQTLTNASNSITGYGTISAPLVNQGLIQIANHATLTLTGSFDNQAVGRIVAPFASFADVQSGTVAQAGEIELRPLVGMQFAIGFTNASGGEITLLDGALHAPYIANAGGGLITGYGVIDSAVTNDGEIVLIADTQILGDLLNNGTITLQSGLLTITGDLLGSGSIIGGFGGRSGGARLLLNGNFDVASNRPDQLDLSHVTFQMSGELPGGVQTFEALSADRGPSGGVFQDSGSATIGAIHVGPSATTVRLVNNHWNSAGRGREAVYVDRLTLDRGATLDLGGCHLYYRTLNRPSPNGRSNPASVIDSVGGGSLTKVD